MSPPNSSQGMSNNSKSQSVDRTIRIRVWILFALFVFKLYVMFSLVFRDGVHPGWILVGVIPGIIIGVLSKRMHIIAWDSDAKMVVSQMDLVGSIILLFYLAYTFFGDDLLEMGLHNAAKAGLVVTSMAVAVTLIRLRHTFHSVKGVLRSAGVLATEE